MPETNKFNLYTAYCHELNQYMQSQPMTALEITKAANHYASTNDVYWIDIKDGDDIVGFLIIGKPDTPECHPDADYGIAQAYVMPEYRGRGYMSEAVQGFAAKHPGAYSLLIIKQNEPALKFWAKLISSSGYKLYPLDSRYVNDEHCELVLMGFKC